MRRRRCFIGFCSFGTPWDILKHNLDCLKLYFFQNFMFKLVLLKLLVRFYPITERLDTSQGRNNRGLRRFFSCNFVMDNFYNLASFQNFTICNLWIFKSLKSKHILTKFLTEKTHKKTFHVLSPTALRNENNCPITALFTRSHASILTGIYLLKLNSGNTRTVCEIWLKLTIKTPERGQWRCSGVFDVNLNIFSLTILVFPLFVKDNDQKYIKYILHHWNIFFSKKYVYPNDTNKNKTYLI